MLEHPATTATEEQPPCVQTVDRPMTLRRVVIVRTDLLGELVLTLTVARRLRDTCPGVAITMVVAPGMEELIRLCPDVTSVISHPPQCDGIRWYWRSLRLGRRLRVGRYDAVMVVNPTKPLHLATWLSGIPIRIGYACKGGRYLLTHTVSDRKIEPLEHEAEYSAKFLKFLGIDESPPSSGLARHLLEPRLAARQLAAWGIQPEERVVAMHPWASKPFKRWPLQRFLALGHLIQREMGVRVVIVGGPEHAAEADTVEGPFIHLTGKTSLTELAVLLKRCECLISNDSGPPHVAAAVGTPSIVLFGTRDPIASPIRWRPVGSGHVIIWKTAMEAIAVDEVFEAVRRLLAR